MNRGGLVVDRGVRNSASAAVSVAARSSPDEAQSRAQSQVATYVGFGLLAYGWGSIGLYILVHIPAGIWLSLALAALGGVIVAAELHIDDPIFYGMKSSDLIVLAVKFVRQFVWGYSGFFARISMIWSLPDLKPEDVEDMLSSKPRTAVPLGAHASETFSEAVDWLQRPELNLGFEDQLYLHSLHQQAEAGDCEVVAVKHNGALTKAMVDGWKALRGLPKQTARTRLPLALAELDAVFASQHPQFAVRLPAKTSGVAAAAQMLLRRIPVDFDVRVLQLQRGLVAALGSTTALAAIVAVRGRRRTWAVGAVSGVALTGYAALVAHGVPVWVLALVGERFGLRKAVAARTSGGKPDAVALLLKLLLRLFSPRVAVPLFAKRLALPSVAHGHVAKRKSEM